MHRSLIGTLFVITANIPLLSKFLWRWWYNRLSAWDQGENLRFMNYGYQPAAGENMQLVLDAEDEPERLCIQLYRHVIGSSQLQGASLAEVGCGRGGGAAYIARYHHPEIITGIDLAPAAIAEARNRYENVPALIFREGAADALPFADQSLDGIINVESSHCYPDMQAFVGEVARVLKPGGFFSFCDIRLPGAIPGLEKLFSDNGLVVQQQRDISTNVVNALRSRDERRIEKITGNLPGWIRRAFADFSGRPDTVLYKMLAQGRCRYMSYLCTRSV